MTTYDEIKAHLRKELPRISKKKLDALADWVYEVNPTEDGGGIASVEVDGARCVVGRTEAFGLELDIDANGDAAAVHFPRGAYLAA